MIAYLLKSAACLALLLGFYHLVLEKEKMHTFNRFYLLIGVLASFLIPLATITTVVYVEPITFSPQEIIGNPVFQTTATEMISEETTIDYNQLFITLYLMISTLFFIRFSSNLFKIINKIRKNTQINYQNAILVLVDDPILPHTFWNYIFIHKNDYENQKIEQELFTHELTHVSQKHTLDVLILEVFQIVFWINPLFIFLKKAIQLNHEFLADEKVIKKHKNTFHYQYLLLNKAAWNNEYYLASNLNYSLTKKRLKMMTTQSSRTKIWFKKLAVIPLLASFIFLFAERVEAQEVFEFKQQNINNKVLKAYKEYGFRDTFFSTKDENDNTIKVPFSMYNNKKKVGPPEPLILKEKLMPKEFFNMLKEGGVDKIIFIDNVNVSSDNLNKYNHSDFSYYSWKYANHNSKINKYIKHYFLETPKYFENQNKKRKKKFLDFLKKEKKLKINEEDINELITYKSKNYDIESYLSLYNIYESKRNDKPHFLQKTKKKREALFIRFNFLIKLYTELSNEDKKKVNKPINPFHPYKKEIKGESVFYNNGEELIKERKSIHKKTSIKQNSNLADFNIKIKKTGSTFNLKCTKGCDWEKLTFNLKKGESKVVDKFGAGNKTDYTSDFKILVKNIEDEYTDYTFTVESLKGTDWLNRTKLHTKNNAEINQYIY